MGTRRTQRLLFRLLCILPLKLIKPDECRGPARRALVSEAIRSRRTLHGGSEHPVAAHEHHQRTSCMSGSLRQPLRPLQLKQAGPRRGAAGRRPMRVWRISPSCRLSSSIGILARAHSEASMISRHASFHSPFAVLDCVRTWGPRSPWGNCNAGKATGPDSVERIMCNQTRAKRP